MSKLTRDRKTDQYGTPTDGAGYLVSIPVAAATKLFAGAIICRDSAGNAVQGTGATGLKPEGRCERQVDNSAGAAGDLRVDVFAGVPFYWDTADIVAADIGKSAYITDDHTVTHTATGKSLGGRIVDVRGDGQVAVWLGMPTFDLMGATGATGPTGPTGGT